MTNPTTRIERDDVIVDVHDEPEAVTITTGSYKHGHPGARLTLHFDYVGELVDKDIESDVEQLLEVAIDRAVGRMDCLEEESALDYVD